MERAWESRGPFNSGLKALAVTTTHQEKVMKTTGKVILKGKNFSIMEASKDDPIYKRGFVSGGRSSSSFSKNIPATHSPKSKQEK